jgi:hypothetical protein
MHPCDARQVPAQLRHGEPVTEGQRRSGGSAGVSADNWHADHNPERSVPAFRKAGAAQGACDAAVPSPHCQAQHCRLAGRERSVGANYQQAGFEQRGGGGPGL